MPDENQELDPVDEANQHPNFPSIHVDNLTSAQKSLHNNFIHSVKSLNADLLRSIFYLSKINDLKIHRLLGFKTIGEYGAVAAGFSSRMTTEFLSLGRQLAQYPQIARALGNGELSWSKAREICGRTPQTEQQHWLEVATKLPRKALREAINSHSPQNPISRVRQSPPAPGPILPSPSKQPSKSLPVQEHWHYLTFKFTSEQKARWERLFEHLQKIHHQSKEELVLFALHNSVHSCPSEPRSGKPPFLVVLLKCPTCGAVSMPTNQGETTINKDLMDSAHCDSMVEDIDCKRRSVIPPRLRRQALRHSRYTCEAQKCLNTQFLEIHHRVPVALGGSTSLDNLVVLCWRCHRDLHKADQAARQALKEEAGQ